MIFYFIAVLLSFSLTFLVRKFSIKKGIIDTPNKRSSHKTPTPRGGGIAIAFCWFLGITYLFSIGQIESNLYFAFLSASPLAMVSFMDDIKSLSPRIRVITQIGVSILAIYFLGGLKVIDFGFYIFENQLLLTLFAIIGVVWFINLFNFLDGIDGYETTEIVFITFFLFLILNDKNALLLGMICLGFLPWNWQKAKIFMGDIGSTLLGFNVAILTIYYQNIGTASIFTLLILSSVFWLDATITLVRRIKNKEILSVAHKKHAYQRIVQAGFSHQKTVIFSLIINILVCGSMALLSLYFREFLLLFFFFNTLILYFVIRLIDKQFPFQ